MPPSRLLAPALFRRSRPRTLACVAAGLLATASSAILAAAAARPYRFVADPPGRAPGDDGRVVALFSALYALDHRDESTAPTLVPLTVAGRLSPSAGAG